MKVVVGLGNPGVQYAGTRHNAGMMLVDLLAQKLTSGYGWRKHYDSLIYKTPDLILVKTKDVFMNESGRLISNFKFQISNLYVAHDDLDLKLGEFKIQSGKGPKVHHGLQSIEGVLGDKDFWRIRIGIDNRATPVDGETYVLQKFMFQEREILDKVLDGICNQLSKS